MTAAFSSRYERATLLAAALALLLAAIASPQAFVKKDASATGDCLTVVNPEVAGEAVPSRCDQQVVAELARSGRAFAQNQTGIESALVLGPNRTIDDARKRFEKAARKGYAPAQVNLAVLYLQGWGVPQNYGAALYWLKAAAEKGNPRAYTNLGILYLEGWGVRQDYDQALLNFRIAAAHGETSAMANLGFMNDNGFGTPKDQRSAADWYRQAAERGDPTGQSNLGDMYLRGEGVPQNDAFALEWFRKAAQQGHTGAQIKLGFLYMTGRATPKDAEAAYSWILAATLAADDRGKEYLSDLEKVLTPEQLARAKERAHVLYETESRSAVETVLVR
jgi:TPR repeat protein